MILRVWCTSHVQPRSLSLLPLSARMVDVWFFSLLLLLLLCLHVVVTVAAASAVSASALSHVSTILSHTALLSRCCHSSLLYGIFCALLFFGLSRA